MQDIVDIEQDQTLFMPQKEYICIFSAANFFLIRYDLGYRACLLV